ncbi:DUF1513 domain-containing protein [Enterovibrio sp. ZSDZ42]|uniref:DUF1513 domain-containing protein n=1 Tax=Enterovibrio gelatinilyticus TaxID=2899819 RepID=A0ABT5R3A5_9GAMM|nr:DUF1513 domain-containing protein [Enterovibrio sp. ZSDZ42]MDD1794746.1 DUF1513 domain-containing protein [Enterovibrio sp. ZSDZ42]
MVSQKRRRMLLSALAVLASGGSVAGGLYARHRVSKTATPSYIGCARQSDGQFNATAIDDTGEVCFTSPLPSRGHGIAVDHQKRLAFVFARRPGTYIRVISTETGKVFSTYHSDPQRYFYGHGDVLGDVLLTTEGVEGSSEGVIGIYRIASNGSLTKLREIVGFGIGPHELKVVDELTLAVAVGGIHTDKRIPMNLGTMKPALVFIDIPSGNVTQQYYLKDHQLSIRHLAVSSAKDVVIAQQYKGDTDKVSPLLAIKRNNGDFVTLKGSTEQWTRFQHYIGSVACTDKQVIATSPRGNCFGVWDIETGELQSLSALMDASGVSAEADRFALSAGSGRVAFQLARKSINFHTSGVTWDNHWVML